MVERPWDYTLIEACSSTIFKRGFHTKICCCHDIEMSMRSLQQRLHDMGLKPLVKNWFLNITPVEIKNFFKLGDRAQIERQPRIWPSKPFFIALQCKMLVWSRDLPGNPGILICRYITPISIKGTIKGFPFSDRHIFHIVVIWADLNFEWVFLWVSKNKC